MFSIAAAHDYFVWNRARWKALNHLTSELKVSPLDIDGATSLMDGTLATWPYQARGMKTFIDVYHNDEFVVSIGPVKGFDVVTNCPFSRCASPGQGNILILKKHKAAS